MQTIKLKNDAVHQVTWCGSADGFLHFELTDVQSVADAASEFNDAENTAQIVSLYDDEVIDTFDGFTELMMSKKDAYTGYITITLRKG